MSALSAVTALSGLLGVVAACLALVTVRLERMAGAAVVVVGAVALCGTLCAGPVLGSILAVGGVALVAPVAVGAVVVGLDGRPPRMTRPWKLVLLVPLGGIAAAVARQGGWGGNVAVEAPAGLLVLLALGAAGLAALLLARRREAP